MHNCHVFLFRSTTKFNWTNPRGRFIVGHSPRSIPVSISIVLLRLIRSFNDVSWRKNILLVRKRTKISQYCFMRRNAPFDLTVLESGLVIGRSSEMPASWQKYAKKKSFAILPVCRLGAGYPEPKAAYIVGAITTENSRLSRRFLLVIKLHFGTVNLIYRPKFYLSPMNVQCYAWW